MFQRISSKFFFDLKFSRKKSQSQQKLSIKITYFAIQACSKHIHFTNLNSLDIENNMLPKHCQKSFWLYKFFRKHVSVWWQKNICTAPFLDTQELHSWRTLKANACIFLFIYLRKCLFQRRVRFHLAGWGMVGGGMISLGVLFLHVWTWCTYILIFHFNWNVLEI